MKVLIANPPAYMGDHKRHFIQAGSRWAFSMFVPKNSKEHYLPYPFGLGYSSAILKENQDCNVEGFDACALDLDSQEFVRKVESQHPDVLFMDVPTISFPLVMDMLKVLKDSVNCKIVLSGGHVTALADNVMNNYPQVDYCVLGEYEFTLKKLVDQFINKENDLKKIEGLAFRRSGKTIVNQPVPQTFNLDTLPYPDRDDFPVDHYHDFEIAGRPCVQMLTTRGCPYDCSFCMTIRVLYCDSHNYRKREPDKIVDEMEQVRDKYGAKQIYFDDDTFAVDRKRLNRICKEIISRKLDVPWTAMGDITLDDETLNNVSRAGCVGIKFGVETVNPDVLKGIGKTFINQEKIKNFVKSCKNFGIWSHATYIVGLPEERRDDIEKTIESAKELDTDSVQFAIATPFPGTPFYEKAKAQGWLVTNDWTRYDGANYSVVSYPWLSNTEIEELHKKALKKWYKNTIRKELLHWNRTRLLIKAGSVRYATRKVLSHLNGRL